MDVLLRIFYGYCLPPLHIMDKIIRFGNMTLNRFKVLEVKKRNSYLYWKHPYTVELTYEKKSRTWMFGGTPDIVFPIISKTTQYTWSYTDSQEAQKVVDNMVEMCPNLKRHHNEE